MTDQKSPVNLVADAIRSAAAMTPRSPLSEREIDQLIGDTVARIWPPQAQAMR